MSFLAVFVLFSVEKGGGPRLGPTRMFMRVKGQNFA